MLLYHYTCSDHGEPGIRRTSELRPRAHPLLHLPLVWLTDLPWPDKWKLGLTSRSLHCKRTEVRVTVPYVPQIEHWPEFADRIMVRPEVREILESGATPSIWYVSQKPLPIRRIEPSSLRADKRSYHLAADQ